MIITKLKDWNALPKSAKAYWVSLEAAFKKAGRDVAVCTHRPDARVHRDKGNGDGMIVRRAATAGAWGKSSDFKVLSMDSLNEAGFAFIGDERI